MLRFLAARRRVLAFFLLWIFSLHALVAQAQWYTGRVNGASSAQTLFWIPPDDNPLQIQNIRGVCVAPANWQALRSENDLDCVGQTLDELKKNQLLQPAEAEKLRTAIEKPGFWQGVAEGFRDALGDLAESIWHLPQLIEQIPSALRALPEAPGLLLEVLEAALEHYNNAVVAYICEPSDAHARALGKIAGEVAITFIPFGGASTKISKISKGAWTAKALEQSLGAFRKYVPKDAKIVLARGDLSTAFLEAFRYHKIDRIVSYISVPMSDGKPYVFKVVPSNKLGKTNSQLVLVGADGKPVPDPVVFEVYRKITGQEGPVELKRYDKVEGYRTNVVGEEPQWAVYRTKGKDNRSYVLRNFADSIDESGPVWTINLHKPEMPDGFEEIKFLRE